MMGYGGGKKEEMALGKSESLVQRGWAGRRLRRGVLFKITCAARRIRRRLGGMNVEGGWAREGRRRNHAGGTTNLRTRKKGHYFRQDVPSREGSLVKKIRSGKKKKKTNACPIHKEWEGNH